MQKLTIDQIAAFCKKKGFVYPNSEIYGGLGGFFDYGPLGVELKNNIKQEWWKRFVQQREDVVGIDGAIITKKEVWEASGHVTSFTEFILECRKCREKYRADHLIEDITGIAMDSVTEEEIHNLIKKHKITCQKCKGELAAAKKFNLMFKTNIGPLDDEKSTAYLRPETAQLIFANFKAVAETSRLKLPFGIAQIGKAFRNEISPREFLFRTREFEQMEIEFFVHPKKIGDCGLLKEVESLRVNVLTTKDKTHKEMTIKEVADKKLATRWHAYWLALSYKFFIDLGVKEENLRLREHSKDELAHYASACFDIEYNFPFGWREIHGNADRKQFDLQQHIKFSKQDLSLYDEETKQRIVPYVVSEPSQGVDRAFLAFLADSYEDDKKRGNIVLRLHPRLAPVKVGVFPLVNKLEKEAYQLFSELKSEFSCIYDRSGSIGRRYARADELGIPYCITVDFDYTKDKTVTVRNRDDTNQVRVTEKELAGALRKLIHQEIGFKDSGKPLKPVETG